VRKILRQLAVISLALASPLVLAGEIFEFGGHTYKIISEPATWEEAASAAAEMSLAGKPGYLARIDSAEENDAVLGALLANLTEEQLLESVANDGSDTAFIWLGGSDIAVEGRWIWSNNGEQFWQGDYNGTPVDDRFTNWGVQPDSATAAEDALGMSMADWPAPFFDLGSSGEWNDLNTNNRLFFVVEFEGLSDLGAAIEEPPNGSVYSGIGMLRGWAVSSDGIEKIEVFINDEYAFDLPHGGPHGNAAEWFPEIPNAESAGYSTPLNYAALGEGEHTITLKVTDGFGSVIEKKSVFTAITFEKAYYPKTARIELGWAHTASLGEQMSVFDAWIDGVAYDILLQWSTVSQSFEIVDIIRTSPISSEEE